MNLELISIAKRINWFDNPETLIKNPNRFLCYFMQYCQAKDYAIVKKHFTQQQFRKALDTAPPGIIDARSRAYWEIVTPKSLSVNRHFFSGQVDLPNTHKKR